MKRLFLLLLTACTLVLFSRAGFCELEVIVDQNKEKDFGQYKTFAWLPEELFAKHEIKKTHGGIFRVVSEAVEKDLIKKGYREVPIKEADLVIVCTSSMDQNEEVSDMGYKMGVKDGPARYGSRVRLGQIGNVRNVPAAAWDDHQYTTYYNEGKLILDFYERKTKELVWRGTGIKSLDMSSPVLHIEEEKLSKSVKEILKEFPAVKV